MPDPRTPSVPGVSRLSPVAHTHFSSVFRGFQDRFDRWVAVKVLHAVPHEGSEAARLRFERECAVTGRLGGHLYVVALYDCGFLRDGRPYLITEFCERGSLADRLTESGALPACEVVEIGAKIAAALVATHRAGVIHRDVKPANILVRAGGEPALADFGVSIRTSGDAGRDLDAFSPGYAPPESLTEGSYSVAGDVYSLGSTLYALLTGRPPVPVVAGESPMAYTDRVVSRPVVPLDRDAVAPEVSDAVHAMLAKRPEDRPTAHDVLLALTSAPGTSGPSRRKAREHGPIRRAAVLVASLVTVAALAAVALGFGPTVAGSAEADGGQGPAPSATASPSSPPDAEDRPRGRVVPRGYHRAAGPEGLVVVVPDGWQIGPAAADHNLKGTDPDDPERFVLFGGEVAEDRSQLERVEELVAQLPDYRPVSLSRVDYGDADDAVDWELAFTLDGQRVRAHGRYWRIDGREYAVYSRAREEDRTQMEAVFDVMVATARPR
jgi:Protein kinase domain